jgi:hypothetical protein
VSGVADPFNGHIDTFRIAHIHRSDDWIATTWNIMSNAGAFAVAGAEEQKGGGGDRHRLPAPAWSSTRWGRIVHWSQLTEIPAKTGH